jgi:hypothetical protein
MTGRDFGLTVVIIITVGVLIFSIIMLVIGK